MVPESFSEVCSSFGIRSQDGDNHNEQDVVGTTSKIPVVPLDVGEITDIIASRLATSLLGHVLFLKNQIPLPVVQLARMANRNGKTKAAKQKTDFLMSYDILTSHFVSTFTSLSTAFAKRTQEGHTATDRAYLAILIGPSLGTAKSKVILAVDGFLTRVWGMRNDDQEECEDDDAELPQDSENEESCNGSESDDREETSDDSDGDSVDDAEEEGDSVGSGEGGDSVDDDDQDDRIHKEISKNASHINHPQSGLPTVSLHQTYAEEQRFLQNAERLLSRILVAADANGCGISNEMSPSQIHVVLRAPRRFNHPSWIPRQNMNKQMDLILSDFLKESWPTHFDFPPKSKSKKQVEGVWITPRNGLGEPAVELDKVVTCEDDEMIWWGWDGKLVGFSDW